MPKAETRRLAGLPNAELDALVHEHVMGGTGKPRQYTRDRNNSGHVLAEIWAGGMVWEFVHALGVLTDNHGDQPDEIFAMIDATPRLVCVAALIAVDYE